MICPICGKPQPTTWQQGSFTVRIYVSANTSDWPFPLPGYCAGHPYTVCPVCKMLVAIGHHSEDDCQRIRGLLGIKPPVAVPQVFYDAFADEEVK